MGLKEDVRSREGLVDSMRDVQLKQFLFLRNLALAVLERFDSAGTAALERAFFQLGFWRGDHQRRRVDILVDGRNPWSLVRNWDSCDLVLADLGAGVGIETDDTGIALTLSEAPGGTYMAGKDGAAILRPYWQQVFAGLAAGFDASLSLTGSSIDPESPAPWTMTCRQPATSADAEQEAVPAPSEVLSDPKEALEMVRRSSRIAGALYLFVAREVIRAFDAAGEQAVRDGVRRIARERGAALRDRHLAEGKSLDLRNLMLDWDGPLISTWIFRDEGHLSPGTWHQDCTYCPYADVWAEYGSEGLALGYLYDVELHTTMYQTYHPSTLVQWEALKTRGDPVCKFRFSIPELVTAEDPNFTPRPDPDVGS